MTSLKLCKGIFLIVGTAIGAGILALPIATVQSGFLGSVLGLGVCWTFMTLAAFFLLDVRLRFKSEIDLSTMTLKTLGVTSQQLLKVVYLLLLFSLVSVYIIVGSTWVGELLAAVLSIDLAEPILQLLFTMAVAALIFSGIGSVSTVNHMVTSVMLMSLLFIIGYSLPSVESSNVSTFVADHIVPTFPLLITAFGFSIVLPSLASYFDYDRKRLRIALIIGSLIIVVTYILWEFIAFGVIGIDGNGLGQFVDSQDKGTEVIQSLAGVLGQDIFNKVGISFMFTAVMSSLIGVGQCLFSYMKDIIPIKNIKTKSIVAIVLGFIAPYSFIQVYPAGITKILSFAGIFVALILGILPAAMIASGEAKGLYRYASWLTIVFFVLIIIVELQSHF